MDRFEEGKRYIFNKETYLTDSYQATMYEISPEARQAVDRFDGMEVSVASEVIGFIDGLHILPSFCQEIIPHLTQVVREVANQRYKTALQKALEQHPEMIEDKQ